MIFDKSKVYTALNADELKVGSKVILANYLEGLKNRVEANSYPTYVQELKCVMGTSSTNRFKTDTDFYNLAYLISEPEEKKLKWTDLKIGDVIKKDTISYQVVGIDYTHLEGKSHIAIPFTWLDDKELEQWEKVE